MKILIADNEVSRVMDSPMLARLVKRGSVDIVQSGRDAVVAYVKSAASGTFYDLVLLDQHLSVLDGFTVVEMIRVFESDHRRSGKRTMVCLVSSDKQFFKQGNKQHTICFGNDERTHLFDKPVNPDHIEVLVDLVASELEIHSHTNAIQKTEKKERNHEAGRYQVDCTAAWN